MLIFKNFNYHRHADDYYFFRLCLTFALTTKIIFSLITHTSLKHTNIYRKPFSTYMFADTILQQPICRRLQCWINSNMLILMLLKK